MRYLVILLLLAGCATERQQVEKQHIAWSAKTSGFANQDTNVTIVMDRDATIRLYVNDKMKLERDNWCVEIVKYVE